MFNESWFLVGTLRTNKVGERRCTDHLLNQQMAGVVLMIMLLHLFLLCNPCSSSPLCTDSSAPFTLKSSLVFCPYNGSVCCDSTEDLRLKNRFQAMNISDPSCASLLKSILCAKCDPFSQELYKGSSQTRTVPLLCNSTVSVNSAQPKDAAAGFCEKVWDTCHNISILNSPFAPSIHGRVGAPFKPTPFRFSDLWQSEGVFCEAFGGSSDNETVCFNGEPITERNSEIPQTPKGLCLERLANGSYLDMVPHPDGSNRVFVANQQGKIWLATIPEEESGETLVLDESSPFLDLTDIVRFDTMLGLMSIAFHPNFAHNGRLFVSFNCDKVHWSECSGRCSCNTDVNCDPSKLEFQNGAMPCQFHSVIAEFTANSSTKPSLTTRANPSEVRRVFTMGLPSADNHAGQILFGPADGYLYFMMGDGIEGGDPYNFSQNKKSLLGKILRFDIDNIPNSTEINDRGSWGNYSIPKDNPYSNDNDWQPEIWALGFRNPWRCSFDSERPSYFICGDCGQYQYEEVDIVKKGGNYGWRVYEGTTLFNPSKSPGGNTSVSSIKPIFPVMGYNHSEVSSDVGSASITGGFFYRSKTDPCMYGRYLYTDLYAGAIWAAIENPENSMNFTTSQVSFSCAHNTPIECSSVGRNSSPSLGYIFAMAEDNKKDAFFLTSKGVYRVARPSRCNYTCSMENATDSQSQDIVPSPSSSRNYLRALKKELLFLLITILLHLQNFTS